MARSTFFLFATLFVAAYALNTCTSNSDCKADSCECREAVGGLSICSPQNVSMTSLITQLGKCKQCTKDSDCDFLGCSRTPGPLQFCISCYADLIRKPLSTCAGIELSFCNNTADCGGSCSCVKPLEGDLMPLNVCLNTKQVESAVQKCTNCTTDADCPNSSCLSSGSFLNRSICQDCQANNTDLNALRCTSAPCVSTSWLRQNGLADATIQHAGSAPVLCIPGLPCGTHGHLLRDADSNLVSYREACERRSDCVESAMPVSQLSHSFDWSTILSSDGELSLTSLSVNPESKAWSQSLIIAKVADGLNSVGLGFICNTVAHFAQRIRNVNIVRMFMES